MKTMSVTPHLGKGGMPIVCKRESEHFEMAQMNHEPSWKDGTMDSRKCYNLSLYVRFSWAVYRDILCLNVFFCFVIVIIVARICVQK